MLTDQRICLIFSPKNMKLESAKIYSAYPARIIELEQNVDHYIQYIGMGFGGGEPIDRFYIGGLQTYSFYCVDKQVYYKEMQLSFQ